MYHSTTSEVQTNYFAAKPFGMATMYDMGQTSATYPTPIRPIAEEESN
jgi:hypothetical protein